MLDPLHKAIGWLLSLFYAPTHNLGLAIILMTAAVMAIMLPLTAKQVRSMVAMQRLQPEIKRLQQQHKEDRQAQSEAIMEFYKENNINPLSGCLPLLVQLPVWIALFGTLKEMPKWVVHHGTAKSGLNLLYADLCGTAKTASACKHPKGLKFAGMNLRWSMLDAGHHNAGVTGLFPYVIMIAIVVLTGFWQMRMTMNRQKNQGSAQQQQNPQMQSMMKIMPIMNLMTAFFPAGIGLYWLTRNVWTIGQQHFVLAKYYEQVDSAAKGKTDAVIDVKAVDDDAPLKRDNTSKKKQQRRKK